jgi:hypothetical protein
VDPQPTGGDDADWTEQATDTVVDLVATVRAKATGPALTAARGVVYGLLAALVAVMSLTLLVVGLVRLVDNYLPGDVWAAHLLVGLLFVLVGVILWSQRKAPAPVEPS